MSEQAEPKSILSINAGSSSLKIKLFDVVRNENAPTPSLILKASSNLASPPAKFTVTATGKENHNIKSQELEDVNSGVQAFNFILKHLRKDDSGFGSERVDQITHICHRVVHGGEIGDKGPLVINDRVIKEIEELITLAPLHNAPAESILKEAIKSLPKARNVAFFDSSFHTTLPDFIRTYPIDQKVAKERKLRKYGFHGLSYHWILKSEEGETSIIALHLGSGASMCAIKNGKSYDTTMGLTPLEGLPGGSRSGTVDPSLIFHYSSRPGDKDKILSSVELSHAENILNSASGFKSLVGTSDFSEILATDPPTSESDLTVKLFLDRILGFLGSYWLKLKGGTGGVDAIVFSGGIGEGSPQFRKMIIDGLEGLNGDFDKIDNERNKKESEGNEVVHSIGDGNGRIKLLVCKTDEELQMVEECLSTKALW
ncbi:hypothetical protein Dda_3353 [Drechslerella dactyloides]|uniref:Probable acetate kinase n=1 Tax=Drechslerella dactyloides TaxID=74499 RepID=A0AAD6J5P3_DREDA|nr:hypothetical protein Dda_3353 [Drechslerella dactyloides]